MRTSSLTALYRRIDASKSNRSVGGGDAMSVADAQTAILLSELDFVHAQTVLDFGCGIGRTMPMLFHKIGRDDLQFDGCDISAEFVKECKLLYQDYPFRFFKIFAPNPHYARFDLSLLDETIPQNFYDIAYSFSVFTHLTLEMAEQTLKRVRVSLAPGGQYYFTMFRLDETSIRAINSGHQLPFMFDRPVTQHDAEYYPNSDDPLAFAALAQREIEQIIAKTEYRVRRFLEGSWRGASAANIHDAYIIERI